MSERKLVAISLNPKEFAELDSKAAAIGAKSVGIYAKAASLNNPVTARRRSKIVTIDPSVSNQLAWIGNNLNQVARALNLARKNEQIQSVDYIAALGFISAIQSDISGIRQTVSEKLS